MICFSLLLFINLPKEYYNFIRNDDNVHESFKILESKNFISEC